MTMIKLQWALSAVLHSEKWMFEPSLTQCNRNVWMCQSAVWSQPRFWLIRLEFSTVFKLKPQTPRYPVWIQTWDIVISIAFHVIFAGTCPTGCECVWPVNETKTKIHHTNCTPSSHTCQSLPSKVKFLPRDFTPRLYTLVTYVPVTTFKGKVSTSRFYSSAIHPRHICTSHYLQR